MRQIELPDGTIETFPAAMSNDEIAAVLRARFGAPPQTPAPPDAAHRQRFGVSPTAAEEREVITIAPKDARADFLSRHRMPRVLRRPPR